MIKIVRMGNTVHVDGDGGEVDFYEAARALEQLKQDGDLTGVTDSQISGFNTIKEASLREKIRSATPPITGS